MLQGGGSLGRQALTVVEQNLQWGTLLPPNRRILDFRHGGHYDGEWSTYNGGVAQSVVTDDAKLAALVQEHLRCTDAAFALFENPIARPNDPFLMQSRSATRFCDTTVLHWLPPMSALASVSTALQEAKKTPDLVGVMGADRRVVDEIGSVKRFGLNTLTDAVAATNALIISAYDGESYVIGVRVREI
jgi:hypothetical protein